MILNAYAIVDGSLALLRLPLALFVLGLAYQTWRQVQASSNSRLLESRYYLLVLVALLLLGLNLVGWPVFYALLQSYVPQWPGVMCIYGVTRIGLGSEGWSRFLPGLIATLQVLKPLVIFSSGAWFVLYLANRQLRKSELLPRVLLLMQLFAIVTCVDAALEVTYLVIPKSEQFLESGCCTARLDGPNSAARFIPRALLPKDARNWLEIACVGLNVGLPIGLAICRFRVQRNWLIIPLLAALLALPVSLAFLVDIAAPTILKLPYHHCPYDLLPAAPETIVGIGLFFLGAFAVGWAFVVDRLGRVVPEIEPVQTVVERLLFVATFGFLAALLLFLVEMVLA